MRWIKGLFKRPEPISSTPPPGIRLRSARSGTISREHYEALEKAGCSEEFLTKLRPIVRDE